MLQQLKNLIKTNFDAKKVRRKIARTSAGLFGPMLSRSSSLLPRLGLAAVQVGFMCHSFCALAWFSFWFSFCCCCGYSSVVPFDLQDALVQGSVAVGWTELRPGLA